MSENKLGVENIIQAVKFLASLSEAVKTSLKDDGKITIGDITNFIKPLMNIVPFISCVTKIPAEFLDSITDEEKDLIIANLKEAGIQEKAVIEGIELVINLKNYIFDNFVNKQ